MHRRKIEWKTKFFSAAMGIPISVTSAGASKAAAAPPPQPASAALQYAQKAREMGRPPQQDKRQPLQDVSPQGSTVKPDPGAVRSAKKEMTERAVIDIDDFNTLRPVRACEAPVAEQNEVFLLRGRILSVEPKDMLQWARAVCLKCKLGGGHGVLKCTNCSNQDADKFAVSWYFQLTVTDDGHSKCVVTIAGKAAAKFLPISLDPRDFLVNRKTAELRKAVSPLFGHFVDPSLPRMDIPISLPVFFRDATSGRRCHLGPCTLKILPA